MSVAGERRVAKRIATEGIAGKTGPINVPQAFCPC